MTIPLSSSAHDDNVNAMSSIVINLFISLPRMDSLVALAMVCSPLLYS